MSNKTAMGNLRIALNKLCISPFLLGVYNKCTGIREGRDGSDRRAAFLRELSWISGMFMGQTSRGKSDAAHWAPIPCRAYKFSAEYIVILKRNDVTS